ncbi:MAG TPA: hypothetical protein VFH59_00885 [Frateuria sp.]|uniref:hypothetical protein n=1 Tax=Frateuria sp. TaxID=2211372 RepID=UPI002D7F26D9|nr:hypothetical protein [Frateuria sp.]HET6803983.1 hypothetical protein [Frateuria sp.]
MSPVIQVFRSRLIRNGVLLAAGCLLKVGVAMGMPMSGTAAPSGTISFSGAVLMATCAAPTAGGVPAVGNLPSRGACRSGESYAGYRFNAHQVGDQPAGRLLEYAKDRYGKVLVLTYVYD